MHARSDGVHERVLETGFQSPGRELRGVLANAHHIKTVPGRKTDVKDCEWIADLLAHGLIRASFIPTPAIRDLRDLTRHRKSLVRDRVKTTNRVHNCWRRPTSSWRMWFPMRWVYRAAPCWKRWSPEKPIR